MPVYFVTGGTGSGKGTYAIRKIQEALDAGKRVATNMDLFLEHLQPKTSHLSPIRLPDIPTYEHLDALGFGSPEDNKNKDDYGLIVLDEISLFLDTAVNPEFKPLMKWFVQRRKRHWDIIFIAQAKDQTQDTAYKALCDNLIICKADDLVPIPYFSDILKVIGFKGMLPEAHTAFTYNGKSEQGSIINTEKYKNKPYRKMYDTDQRFDHDVIINDTKIIDMRAIYTYLPASILTRQKYIDYHESRIEALKNPKKETDMAKAAVDPTLKFKIAFLIIGVLVFLWFKNPMDNPLLSGDKEVEQPYIAPPPASETTQTITPDIAATLIPADDLIRILFRDYTARLTGQVFSETLPPVAYIDFYEGDTIVQRLTIKDFNHHGYTVIPSGTEAVIVRGPNFNKRVTPYLAPVAQTNPSIINN